MTVFQQISPSSLRAYKLSKYANGQPNKILLEAKKAKRATSQFMSRKGAREAAKRMKALKKTTRESKNILDKFLKKIPGKDNAGKATSAGVTIGGLLAIAGLTAALIIKEFQDAFIQGVLLDSDDQLRSDIQKQFDNYIKQAVTIRGIQKQTKDLELENQRVRDRVYSIEKQQPKIRENANNALYETRQGRVILEGKIAEAKKQSNDALYETRQGREKLQSQIDSIQATIKQTLSGIGKGLQQQVSTTIANIQKGLQQAQADTKKVNGQIDIQNKTISSLQANNKLLETKINSIKQPTPTDVNAVINAVKAGSLQEINKLRGQVNGLVAQLTGIQAVIPVLSGGISNVAKSASTANEKANSAMNEARSKGVPDLSPLQKNLDNQFNKLVEDNKKSLGIQDLKISDLGKKFNQQLQDFERQSNLNANQRFAEFTKQNNEALGIRDLKISDLGKDFDKKLADFQRQSNLDAGQRYKEFIDQNKRDLQKIGNDLSQNKSDIKDLEKQIKEQDKVNQESNKKLGGIDAKLDSIIPTIAGIPLIVGKGTNDIINKMPTPGDIEAATGRAMCTNFKTGCGKQALDNLGNNINNNTNNAANNILQGLDTAGTGALLAGQQQILNRLGDQIPGGLGRLITQITRNQAINQIANLVTMAAAIHNVIQLSDNVAVTFFGILDNIFAIPTLIINPEANTIDTREVFNGAIENVMKSVFGVEEWAEIKAKWAAFNRIYQAAANSVNEIRSIGSSLGDAISTTATLTGRGFNALQNDGILSDDNWEPTPENLRLKGGIYAKLGKLADGITVVGETLEAIESVTSEIRSAVESANQIKSNTTEMEAEVKKLLGEETVKRDEAIAAIQAPTFNYEDLL